MALKNPRSVTLMIEEEDVLELAEQAEKQERSMAQVIRFAIKKHLADTMYHASKKERKAR